MKRLITALFCTASLAIAFVPASGSTTVEVAGVHFERSHELPGGNLKLRGQALLRYMVFVKAYAGALYLPEDIDHRQALDPVPRRLEIAYFHAIQAADFAKATRKKMADNTTPEEMERLSERLAQFNALYRDVQPGDRYALTYRPELGTVLSLNGRRLGMVAGDDFAAALFAIWLGPQPIDRDFKKALLGLGEA